MTAPSPTGAALLRACLLAPADDAPRLVYADWLDENPLVPCPDCGGGRPGAWHYALDDEGRCRRCGRRGASGTGLVDEGGARAEFIRLQVLLAGERAHCQCGPCVARRGGGQHHNGPCAQDRVWVEIDDEPVRATHRARHLLAGRGAEWAGPVATACGAAGLLWQWDRGFVEAITVTTVNFLSFAADIFAAHPVTGVSLPDRRPVEWYGAHGHPTAHVFCARPTDAELDARSFVGDPSRDFPHWLPAEIFRLLDGHDGRDRGLAGLKNKGYPTQAAALAALSDALVAHGRALVGLTEPARV